jgi:hypothetical protein
MIKNTISCLGIFFATHSMLFLHHRQQKNISTNPMGENPLISDGKLRSSSLMEIADKLSENFDASVKNSRSPPPPPRLPH